MSMLDIRNRLLQQLLGRTMSQGDINAVGGEQGLSNAYGSNQESGQYNDIINSQEYRDRLLLQARDRFAPNRDTALNSLTSEQNTTNNNYADAMAKAKTDAQANTKTLEERNNQLGLLQSGLTQAGEGKITSDLTQLQGRSSQDLATKLADINTRRTAASTGYDQNVQDWMNTQMDKAKGNVADISKSEQDNAIKALTIAKDIPYGQTVNIPGLGEIKGLKQDAPDNVMQSVNGHELLIDRKTGNTIRDLGATTKTSSGSTGTTKTSKPYKPTTGYKQVSNEIGGLGFTNNTGKPITAAQYLANKSADGQTVDKGAMIQLLSQSRDPSDQQIIQDINSGMSYDQLKQLHPYVFNT